MKKNQVTTALALRRPTEAQARKMRAGSKRQFIRAFYRGETVTEDGKHDCANAQRPIHESQYNRRCGHVAAPGEYDRYFIRAVQRKEVVRRTIGNCMERVIERMGETDGIPPKQAGLMLMDDLCSMDTLFGDLWRALYLPESSFKGDGRPVSKMLRFYSASSGFETLRDLCLGDPIRAALVALDVINTEGTSNGFGDQASASKDDKESQGQGDPEDGKGDADSGKADGKAQKQADSAVKEAASKAGVKKTPQEKKNEDKLDLMVAKLAGNGFQEPLTELSQVQRAADIVDAQFSAGGDGGFAPALKNAFDLLGRYEALMADALRVSKIGDGEIVNITTGSDMCSMIPAEYMNLVIEEMETLFFTRLNEGGLLVLEREAHTGSGAGPVIIMLDCSISMGSRRAVDRQNYCALDIAAGFALGLLEYATSYGRPVAVIPFNGDVAFENVGVFDRSPSRTLFDIESALTRSIGVRPGGGTDFGKAMIGVKRVLDEMPDKDPFRYADIIYFTDGEGQAPTDPSAIAECRKGLPKGTRVFGFFLANTLRGAEKVEKENAGFFDICKGTTMETMDENLKKFFTLVMEKGFYRMDD